MCLGERIHSCSGAGGIGVWQLVVSPFDFKVTVQPLMTTVAGNIFHGIIVESVHLLIVHD